MPDGFVNAVLGSFPFTMKLLKDQLDFGGVEYDDEESQNIWADVNTQLRRRANKLRHMKLGIILEGTDKDDLLSQEHDLRRELAKEVNTLVVQPTDASLSTLWVVRRNPAVQVPFDYAYDKRNTGLYTTEIVCDPWGLGPSETAATESIDGPALIDLGTLDGQGKVPLNVDVARGWGTPSDGDGIQHTIVALCRTEGTIDDYLLEAESFADTTGWDIVGGSSSSRSGSFLRHDADDAWHYTTAPVDSAPAGRYRVFARAKTSDSGNAYIGKRKQSSTNVDPKTKQLVTETWQWYDLGEWVNYDGGPDIRIWAFPNAGSFCLDYIMLVPIDWYWMRYTDDAQHTMAVHFGWLYDQRFNLTTDATWRDATQRMFGHGLKAELEGMSLLVAVEQKDGADPSPPANVAVTYQPRWESFR